MQHTAPRPLIHRWMRPVYFTLGVVSLAIGVIGIPAPLIPTTGPVLLAAFFFARSSDRFHDWLINHPRFGPLIADFRAGKGIPLATKVWALTAMTAAFGFSILFLIDNWLARGLLIAVAILAIGYVARLPVVRR
ncbi:MAG: YbaN family protein [Acidimicrobiia bacterium]|nr:YbaN family protein [Acidimicrobiia bacterium]